MFVDAVTFRLIHMSIPDLITWCHSTYCLGEPQNPPWFGVWTIFQIQKCHWCSPFQTQTRLIHSYIYYICIPAHAGHIFNYIYTCRCRWVCVCLGVRLYLDNPPSILWSWIQPSPSGFHMFIPIHLSSGPIPNEIIHWVASRDNLQFYTGCSGFYRIGPNCRGLWNQPEFHPDQFQKFKILVMAKCGGCVGF